ncbi:glutathione S-transferase family protein [Ruegeria halocynthiae]|uniref:glutathione S-transferase family protein n=1 Tax=Ruegeria halocynthiae TaxID=985054 RepID=UPI00068C1254|nr:glutathione S-transferase [Ruegeria halocynthiae]
MHVETAMQPAKSSDARLIVYDAPGSPCARRVKISLIEKGLQFQRIAVNLTAMEQKRSDYLALNPNGVVPTLSHGSRILFEANVITRYLDEAFPETKRLYPTSLVETAEVFRWQEAELEMAKKFRPLLYQRAVGPVIRMTKTLEEALATARANGAQHENLAWETRVWSLDVVTPEEEVDLVDWHKNWLRDLEAALAHRRFLLGDSLSMADISVAPRVALYPTIAISLTKEFPKVANWLRELTTRPSFASTVSDEEQKLAELATSPILPAARRQFGKDRLSKATDRLLVGMAAPLLKKLVKKSAAANAPLSIPDYSDKALPSVGAFENEGFMLTGRIKLAIGPKDPAHQAVALVARTNCSNIDVQAAQAFLLKCDDVEIRAPNFALEVLSRQANAEFAFPGSVEEAAQVRCWLAFAAGAEREFRPLVAHRQTSGSVPGFTTDKSMAKLEVARRCKVLDEHLATNTWLVGHSPTVADVRWGFELDALERADVEVSGANVARWRKILTL